MQHYDFEQVESEAQAHWQEANTFVVGESSDKPKYYTLSMLPYPSGALHMGHVRNYTIGDVISRFKKMDGYNVMQPMGWDAFGMPAENAAIERGEHPAKWTYANIANTRKQFFRLGFGYDWDREITTCKPEYYRWEQWFFTKLIEKGLAYKKSGFVNWCETDQTVLANEQVEEGCCWRCGKAVERREIPQWYLKITDYAQELLDGLDDLDGWPESVKTAQRNWIGRSEGVEFDWQVEGHDNIRVYTTRPDTLMGVTFMAIAAEHPLATAAAQNNSDLQQFIDQCKSVGTSEAVIETMEKRGMETGLFASHPVSGEAIPIWVGNYVLITYGGGAVMGVPGHDQRDYDFAKKYNITIVQVVDSASAPVSIDEQAFTAKTDTRTINSSQFDGLDSQAAFAAVADYLQQHANGEAKINFRIRDWLVSRQRYWGCPIPAVYDDQGTPFPVREQDLPVVLPEDVTFTGVRSPLKNDPNFYANGRLPDGSAGTRETDTFDTFFESSWYYARYCCPDANAMLDDRANYWLPIDQYIGGIEHAVMHLLYFRFFHKLMRDIGLVTTDEPCKNLLTQGMVVSEIFYREIDGRKKYYYPTEVELAYDERGRVVGATHLQDGQAVLVGGVEKMSKSKNNGVDPNAMINKYGADTVRLFSMFAAPPEQSLEWNESGVEGMQRFLRRLWRLSVEMASEPSRNVSLQDLDRQSKALRRKAYETLSKVNDDFSRRHTFNTAIAAIMELYNDLQKLELSDDQRKAVAQEVLRLLLLMLAPITPHICHVLWGITGNKGSIAEAPWPEIDPAALERDSIEIVVQVNGKLRAKLEVAIDAGKDTILEAAKANEAVQKFISQGQIVKEIVVPGKLVNFVVK